MWTAWGTIRYTPILLPVKRNWHVSQVTSVNICVSRTLSLTKVQAREPFASFIHSSIFVTHANRHIFCVEEILDFVYTESIMESTLVVSAILEDFYAVNNSGDSSSSSFLSSWTILADSCKVLLKLIQNASRDNAELKYRRVRLQNARIQATVVSVPGALDVLGLAGFQRGIKESSSDDQNKDDANVLVYTDSPQNQEMSSIICHNLETKLEEFQKLSVTDGNVAASPPAAAVATTPAQASDSSVAGEAGSTTEDKYDEYDDKDDDRSPFLSEPERQRRREAAKAARKARAAERSRALQAWREDEEDRKIKASRRETALQDVIAVAAAETYDTNNNESTPPNLLSQLRIRGLLPTPSQQPQQQQQQHVKPETNINTSSESLSAATNNNAVPSQYASASHTTTTTSTTAGPTNPQPNSTLSDDVDMHEAKPAPATATAAAQASAITMETEEEQASESWKEYLQHTPLCAPAPGIRETSYFSKQNHQYMETGTTVAGSTGSSRPACLRKLFKELDTMNESLPSDPRCTIFVRFDEETPQYLRALIPAALPGPTPYSGGLYCFDIYIPHEYPRVAPTVVLLTTGGGSVRFGPNLYADGKVCLSLLGTWEGPKWKPNVSTLNQVLISIQGLVLGAEHPYYLEPGHGGWEGRVKEGSFQRTGHTLRGGAVQEDLIPMHVAVYENRVRVATLRFAMLDMLGMVGASSATTKETTAVTQGIIHQAKQDPDAVAEVDVVLAKLASTSSSAKYLQPFVRPIRLHFYQNRHSILKEVETWTRCRCLKAFSSSSQQQQQHHTHDVPMMEDEQEFGNDNDDDNILHGEYRASGRLEQVQAHLLRQITSLYEKLQGVLSKIDAPSLTETQEDHAARISAIAKSVLDSSSKAQEVQPVMRGDNASNYSSSSKKEVEESSQEDQTITCIDDIRQRMQAAAGAGDYILAGKLQESLKLVEGLQVQMEEAASQSNFIRAGRLQEQLNVRMASLNDELTDKNNNKPRALKAPPRCSGGTAVRGGGGGRRRRQHP